MVQIIQRPADYAAWRALLEARGIVRPAQEMRTVLVQIASGRSWLFETNGTPLALAGILHGTDRSEAWFSATAGAGHMLLPLCRLFRLQLDIDQRMAGGALVTRTHIDNLAGQRLARVLGFRPSHIAGRALWWERSHGSTVANGDRCGGDGAVDVAGPQASEAPAGAG